MTFVFKTTRGRCALVYDSQGVQAVTLGTQASGDRGPHPARLRKLAAQIRRALTGQRVDFSRTKLSTRGLPPFHVSIYQALLAIPWGVTLSYGELATRAGRPGAARAVGQAMARSRWSVVMPCLRVVRSDGSLGGYGGPGGLALKRKLLDAELDAPPLKARAPHRSRPAGRR